ncbi:MAG: glycosyl transferase [Rubellimicrobium sp.]|nr:glycosyl transferase [Rubellimicrobium sp.]
MSLGVVMLVHTAFDRAEQVIRHLVAAGCPVVVHVDRKVAGRHFDALRAALVDLETVRFSPRNRCEWGGWGLVAATQAAAGMLLRDFPDVRHVYLMSGACLPLRPVAELQAYLDAHPDTDFIESATTADVPWTVGGLSGERFTLRFPFSWRRHRRLFDGYVRLQRRLRFRRRIPEGLVPHMGSQWWCLTRRTLSAILSDPRRAEYDHYFRRVWIPDESYFQSLARLWSPRIESRSLTLSKFDFQGKPHVFYDDHLQLLRRSDCFVARKIWPQAAKLYRVFLNPENAERLRAEPNPGRIDRIFAAAVELRTKGRPGLWMQSRFPHDGWENGVTAAPWSVFEGFADLFPDFESWLARMTGLRVHGHLFAPDRVEFEGRQPTFTGALTDRASIRDHHPEMFLRNLIWNTRGERQCFQFGPADNQAISWPMAKDGNAQVAVISGAWAIPLFLSNRDFADIRTTAARLQRIETDHLWALRSQWARARVQVWTLAEFVENPMEHLQAALAGVAPRNLPRVAEAPRMVDLAGFGQFLQNLKNQGMHPTLTGDFPAGGAVQTPAPPRRKPYLVRGRE